MQNSSEGYGDLRQNFVAGLPAEAAVDITQVVNVDEDDRRSFAYGLLCLHVTASDQVQALDARKACQIIPKS